MTNHVVETGLGVGRLQVVTEPTGTTALRLTNSSVRDNFHSFFERLTKRPLGRANQKITRNFIKVLFVR